MLFLSKMIGSAKMAQLDEWKKAQTAKIREMQNLSDDEPLKVGAIGGLYTYSFTPTSIGIVIKATNGITADTLDLSDYDGW